MSEPAVDAAPVKAAVQEHYSKAITAATATGGCCGSTASSCCSGISTELRLHGPETLASLPADVVTASFGCGNPLALASLQPGEVVLDLGSGGGLEVLLAPKRVGASGYVYGRDMTDAMLDIARRNAEKAGVQNIAFLKDDHPEPGRQLRPLPARAAPTPGSRRATRARLGSRRARPAPAQLNGGASALPDEDRPGR